MPHSLSNLLILAGMLTVGSIPQLIHAQGNMGSPYGGMGGGYYGIPAEASLGCVFADNNGKVHVTNNMPGCKVVKRGPVSDGEAITVEVTPIPPMGSNRMPGDNSSPSGPTSTLPSPPPVAPRKQTMIIHRKDGQLTGYTTFPGDDLKSAKLAHTTELNPDATHPQNRRSQSYVRQNAGGTTQNFVTFDRNLCARFKDVFTSTAGADALMKLQTECKDILTKLEDAANEFNKKFGKENKKLGAYTFSPDGETNYRATRSGSTMDLLQLLGNCQFFLGGASALNPFMSMPPPMPPPSPMTPLPPMPPRPTRPPPMRPSVVPPDVLREANDKMQDI